MRKKRGFTFLELMIIILILAILITLAVPQYQSMKERAYAVEAIRNMQAMMKIKIAERFSDMVGLMPYYSEPVGDENIDCYISVNEKNWSYQYGTGGASTSEMHYYATRKNGPYKDCQIELRYNPRTKETIWRG